jgi:hypothetical protein
VPTTNANDLGEMVGTLRFAHPTKTYPPAQTSST